MDRSGSLRSEVPVRSHYYSRYRFFHSWGQWVRAILHVPPSGLASVGGPHRGRACVCQGAALLSFAFTHSLLSHRLPRQSLGSYPFFDAVWLSFTWVRLYSGCVLFYSMFCGSSGIPENCQLIQLEWASRMCTNSRSSNWFAWSSFTLWESWEKPCQ